MKKSYHSYKLKEDSLEKLAQELLQKRIEVFRLSEVLKTAQNNLSKSTTERDELQAKLKYLLRERKVKSVTIDRIKFQLVGDELKISLILD